jgi:hypothetical protein
MTEFALFIAFNTGEFEFTPLVRAVRRVLVPAAKATEGPVDVIPQELSLILADVLRPSPGINVDPTRLSVAYSDSGLHGVCTVSA